MEPGGDGDGYVTPVPPRPPGGSARVRWLGVLAGFAVLVGIVVLQRHSGNAPAASGPAPTSSPAASSTTTPSSTVGPTPSPTQSAPSASPTTSYPVTAPFSGYGGTPPPDDSPQLDGPPTSPSTSGLATTVTTLSSRPITTSPGWEIVGYSLQGLVRIFPDTGRVVVVPGSRSGSDGSLTSLVSVPGRTILTGYGPSDAMLFPDSGPMTTPSGMLAASPVVLPGPDPDHLWVLNASSGSGYEIDRAAIPLVDWRGKPTKTSISVPAYLTPYGQPVPDGDGYVMMAGVGGTYDLRPGSVRLITHGIVLAAGPTGYLAYECGDTPRCQMVVIDRSSGSRRTLPIGPLTTTYAPITGLISADGAHAAFAEVSTSSSTTREQLIIVDLATGDTRSAAEPLNDSALYPGGFGFSPDGRYLAMALDGGDVGIVDVKTGAVDALGLARAGQFVNALVTRADH
jgi:hypothetical protein